MMHVWDQSIEGQEFVINQYRSTESNLRTQFLRIVRSAGLKPWPKIFHNLRASRETELMKDHPIHVVCDWIGNTNAVAMKHYLQVTEDDFIKAVRKGTALSDAEGSGNKRKQEESSFGDKPDLQHKSHKIA